MSSVPESTVQEILARSRKKCCVCREEGHQIHHIDGVSSNHSRDNLVLLCLQHHHQAEREGGLGRELNPERLRSLRDMWYRTVAKQEKPTRRERDTDSRAEIPPELHYQASLDAQITIQVRQLSWKITHAEGGDWDAHQTKGLFGC